MLTATKGTAVLNTIFREYAAWCGDILTRENGSLVGHETGQARPINWAVKNRKCGHRCSSCEAASMSMNGRGNPRNKDSVL